MVEYSKMKCELDRFLIHAKEYGSELAGPPSCYCEKCLWIKLKQLRDTLGIVNTSLIATRNKVGAMQKELDRCCGTINKLMDAYQERKRGTAEGGGESPHKH